MNNQNNMVLMMGNQGNPGVQMNVNHPQTSKNAVSKSSNFSQNILQQIGAASQNTQGFSNHNALSQSEGIQAQQSRKSSNQGERMQKDVIIRKNSSKNLLPPSTQSNIPNI